MKILLITDNIRHYLVLLFLAFVTSINGQINMQEKRIYLVDATASMIGKGTVASDNIFGKVKNELKMALNMIEDPNTEITIVTFTNKVHRTINGLIKDKTNLLTAIDKLNVIAGDTNIADAWEYGIGQIDKNKINYLFLLTDGLHNSGPDKDVLYGRLKHWETFSLGKYLFGFYVMLTKQAREPMICDIINSTGQLWLIESMNVNVTFVTLPMRIKANIRQTKNLKLKLKASTREFINKNIPFSAHLEKNPYYSLQNVRHKNGYLFLSIKELQPIMKLPLEISLKLYINYNKKKNPLLFFTPEILNFNIHNQGVRSMTIKDTYLQ